MTPYRTVSLTAAIACVAAALAVGTATGLAAAHRGAPEPARAVRALRTGGGTPSAPCESDVEVAAVQAAPVASHVAPTDRASLPDDREAKLALARRMYDVFSKMESGRYEGDSEDVLALIGRLDELDESMAGFFLDRHRENARALEGRIALMLAFACGGSEVAAFLVERLNDPYVSPGERCAILPLFDARSIVPPGRIPVSPALAETARRLLISADPQERIAGAGLLGGDSGPSTLAGLARAAGTDPDEQVRLAAVRALGRCGDEASIQVLRTLLARSSSLTDVETIEGAIRRIAARHPDR